MEKMKYSVENVSGVKAVYMVNAAEPTGTCGVLVTSQGKNRSLVANLGAANHFEKSHIEAHKLSVVDKAKIIYSSGFFITAAADSLEYLAQHVSSASPLFAFNLAAPFICQVEPFRNVLMATVPYVDFLFGNDAEASALAEALGWAEVGDLCAIAQKLANLEKKGAGSGRKRVVVITNGSEPTIVATQGESVPSLFPIIAVKESEIVDSNGCGDAYAGAFIAGLALDKSIPECCQAGAYAAHQVIQRSGVTLPEKSAFQWSI
jgi:adenosine kinase